MWENGLEAREPHRFERTTDNGHAFPVAHDPLHRNVTAAGPDRKWGADIAHVRTREGSPCLAAVLDPDSRRGVGWAAGDRLHGELALTALRRAPLVRQPPSDLMHRSDRGSQSCANERQAERREIGIAISMSGKGDFSDDAMVETFSKALKSERVWRTAFQTRAEAIAALARSIDGVADPHRRPSASPAPSCSKGASPPDRSP
jgi:transposase InsO family protein